MPRPQGRSCALESAATDSGAAIAAGPLEPAWESLGQYVCPEWFRDAKFGIPMHWGVCSVAAHGGWYGRYMYLQEPSERESWGRGVYDFHVRRGPQHPLT